MQRNRLLMEYAHGGGPQGYAGVHEAAHAARETKATTKVDKRPRPVIHEEMSEHDWRFFLSEWQDYTRATGVTGQYLLDELWSCMSADLRRLAFNQGSKEDLDTETKMMERIKGLAVSVLMLLCTPWPSTRPDSHQENPPSPLQQEYEE